MAHLRRGNARVAAGDAAVVDRAVAEIGNSGANDAPHLHVHAAGS